MQQLIEKKLKKSGKKPESRRKSKPRKQLKQRKKPEKRPKSGRKKQLKKREVGSTGESNGLGQCSSRGAVT